MKFTTIQILIKGLLVLSFMMILNSGCAEPPQPKGSPEYIDEINDWHSRRIENLKKPNGWLNLVGLHWLEEGENTFGSGQDNDIVFPAGKSADRLGTVTLNDGVVELKVEPGVEIISGDDLVTSMTLENDMSDNTTMLTHGTLAWFIIKRENKYGIRLRDYEADLLSNFEGIERYPVNEDWRVEAQYVPYDPPKKLSIPSIIGTVSESDCYGKLVFEKNGETYSLDPLGQQNLFLIFADQTNGNETYGAGRFLSVAPPDSTGKTFIDFNKAYNPPCAFTRYATCPLPPKDNYLKLEVTAGEKSYGDH